MKKLILFVFVLGAVSPVLGAQTPHSTIRAGVGMLATEMDLNSGTQTDSRGKGVVVGPAISVEYNYHLIQSLSCSVLLGAGHASYDGTLVHWYETNSEYPYKEYKGVISSSNHFSAAILTLFRPNQWLETGLGVSSEFTDYTHARQVINSVSYPPYDYEEGRYSREEYCVYHDLQKIREFKYGVVLPVRLYIYSDPRYEVMAFYNLQFWRLEKGRWAKGTGYAGVTLGVNF